MTIFYCLCEFSMADANICDEKSFGFLCSYSGLAGIQVSARGLVSKKIGKHYCDQKLELGQCVIFHSATGNLATQNFLFSQNKNSLFFENPSARNIKHASKGAGKNRTISHAFAQKQNCFREEYIQGTGSLS